MAFPGMKQNVVCRNGHTVGTLEGRTLTVNVASNIKVIMPDGSMQPWNEKVRCHQERTAPTRTPLLLMDLGPALLLAQIWKMIREHHAANPTADPHATD